MDRTHIEWADATWNPLRGCSRVSEGCMNCYAERVAARFSGPGQPYEGLIHYKALRGRPAWNGQIRLVPELLDQPRHWKQPRRIFVNSMSDLFHENVPAAFVGRVFEVMAACPQHTFIVLTKRPERIAPVLGPRGCGWYAVEGPVPCPQPNVWIGVSVEDQGTAEQRIPQLLGAPNAMPILSVEPQLGPIDLLWDLPPVRGARWNCSLVSQIRWLIVGGESGKGARPFYLEWAQSLINQADAQGVPIFIKQLGAFPVGADGKEAFGINHPKGADMSEWPEPLRVREFPRPHGVAAPVPKQFRR